MNTDEASLDHLVSAGAQLTGLSVAENARTEVFVTSKLTSDVKSVAF